MLLHGNHLLLDACEQDADLHLAWLLTGLQTCACCHACLAVSMLSRLCDTGKGSALLAQLAAGLCEAAAASSAVLLQQAAELLVLIMAAPCASKLCDQLR